jgi:hypothetical protein
MDTLFFSLKLFHLVVEKETKVDVFGPHLSGFFRRKSL